MFNEQEQYYFEEKDAKVQFSDIPEISEDTEPVTNIETTDKENIVGDAKEDDEHKSLQEYLEYDVGMSSVCNPNRYGDGCVDKEHKSSSKCDHNQFFATFGEIAQHTDADEFIDRLKHIHRDGIDELIDFIKNSGFLTAPASTKYHGAYVGGLVRHSLNVHDVMRKELDMTFGNEWKMFISEESVAIVSLLHDLCKTDMYIQQMRNVKVNGEWTQELYYAYNQEQFSMGHSAKTIHMIQRFIKLTDEEAQAIYWHMGAFDLSQYSTAQGMGNAYTNNLLAFFLHLADMKSTYINENDEFWEHYREIQKMKAPADRT